jgi:hypothetical protein
VTPLGLAALKLAARGLRVFPIVPRTKTPAIKDNLRLATIDDGIIGAWWRNLDFNIGIATGQGSGVWVLDLDGAEHEAWLRERESQHGVLPPTIEAITGKGRHLYFKWPAGADIRNVQSREDLPDVRGEGGYILAPPSIHPSGRRYCWSVDSATAFADAPEWLIGLVVKGGRAGSVGEPFGATPEAWRSFVDDRFDGSHRGFAIARLAGLLLRKFVDPYVVLSICRLFNANRCDEPLSSVEVERIVDAIAGREVERRTGDGQA